MTPERWRQISEVFHAAKQRDRGEQSSFVTEVCGDDLVLRQEVTRLLQAHHDGEGFGSSPVMLASAQLASGRLFGPYRIESLLGAGGMGDVYRARDTNLNRAVALKVLPEAFALDADRLARFKREAQVLASLNHPNIAAIYGLETSDGIQALVLELIEGPTLADRIAQGPIPPDEVLPIARQIAEALEAAHEQGIIHRDLKPANIKVRPDGTVKVLDFGLAKWLDPGMPSGDIASSPTITAPAMPTGLGVIVGTPAYMSPEQASGKNLDKRTDIWAFACVLYEMLTARHAFGGDEVTATLGSVLTKEPDWNALPSGTPVAVRRLLSQCLQKDPRRRTHDIGDARLEIERLLGGAPEDEPASATAAAAPLWRRALPWGLASVLGVALALVLVRGALRGGKSDVPSGPIQFAINLPVGDTVTFESPDASTLALSPDGRTLVFAATRGGVTQLYRRRFDDLNAQPINGTANGISPFISADGRAVGFFHSSRQMMKVPLEGGAPIVIAEMVSSGGGTANWGTQGTIVFGEDGVGSNVAQVPSSGGTIRALTQRLADKGEQDLAWPELLPSGRAVIFSVDYAGGRPSETVVQSVANGERRTLAQGYAPHYSPSGHLVFMRENTIWAVAFDADRLEMRGQPVPIVQNVQPGQFAISATGTLAYTPLPPGTSRTLVWVDQLGREEPLPASTGLYRDPRLSSDGQQLVLSVTDNDTDVWIYDLDSRTFRELTSSPGLDVYPLWTRDGRRVVFSSARQGIRNLFWQAANGSGAVERLTTSSNIQSPWSWSPDDKVLIFQQQKAPPAQDFDIYMLSMPQHEPRALLQTDASELEPQLSPNGKWLAYREASDVWVRPFPNIEDGRWRISIGQGGGYEPKWSADGSRLFYVGGSPASNMMGVDIAEQPSFTPGTPKRLFDLSHYVFARGERNYDVARDGRFLLMKGTSGTDATSPAAAFVIVTNWASELTRLVPAN